MASIVASGLTISVQSALGSANTISGITKADPPVVTYTGADPSNGDYVLFTVEGMDEINNCIGRVANVNAGANTFEIEGVGVEDSTLFSTFTSGSFQVVTFGTTLSIVSGFTSSGGKWEEADVTLLHELQRSTIPTVREAVTRNLECAWSPENAGAAALVAASKTKAQRAILISFANSYRFAFNGYIGFTNEPESINFGELVKCTATVSARGTGTAFLT